MSLNVSIKNIPDIQKVCNKNHRKILGKKILELRQLFKIKIGNLTEKENRQTLVS